MTLHSAIEPWADSLLGWSLQTAPELIRSCPQVSRDGDRLRPFWACYGHRKDYADVLIIPHVLEDGVEIIALYGAHRRRAMSLLMEPENARGRLVAKDWKLYCRAFVCVRFSARSAHPDFIVMESASFAATPHARRELLEKRYGRRIDLEEWDEMLGTDFTRMAQQFRQVRDEAIASIVRAAREYREIGSRPLP